MPPELSTKQLDLLKQIAPRTEHTAVLWTTAVQSKLSNALGLTILPSVLQLADQVIE